MKKLSYLIYHWKIFMFVLCLVPISGIAGAAELDDLRDRIEDLEEIVEELEKQSSLDRILLTAELRATHHNFDYYAEKTATDPETKEHGVANQLRFRLNMRSDIRNNLRFIGRLTMFKNWGDKTTLSGGIIDLGAAGLPSDSTVKVERAYLDYFLHPRFSFSIGRLAGSDGPPSEYAENTPRRSAYPMALYNIELDGIVGTIHLPSWHPTLRNSAFRLIYGELGTYDSDTIFRDDGTNNMEINVLQAETEILKKGLEGLVVVDYLFVENFTFGRSLFEENLESTEKTLGFPLAITDYPRSFGKVSRQLLHAQFNFSSLGIFVYATYDHTKIIGNGKRLVVSTDIPNVPSTPIYCFGFNQSLDCSKPPEKVTTEGNAVNVGMAYTLPLNGQHKPKIGAEYHQASKDHLANGLRSDYGISGSGFEFYNVLGNASHLYWIQPLESNLFVRAGVRQNNPKYSSLEDPGDEDTFRKLQDVYLLINAEF